ncbi:phage terminase large subunit family protein [Escherichia coli]
MISDELRAANSAGAIATGLLALKIPVPLTTVQWADRHYYLPKESSYTPGRWETLPFQVAIMNSMGNDRIRTVNLIKSARVGYTKMLLGVQIVYDWLDALKDPNGLKTFVNTTLGETWEEAVGEKLDHQVLMDKVVHYTAAVPARVVYLTAGIDSQRNRFEMYVWGWAPGEEAFLVDKIIIMGRPDEEETLLRVDAAINKKYCHADGTEMTISRVCWDTGGIDGEIVYQRSKKHGVFRVLPVKGASVYGKPVITMPKTRNQRGVYLCEVGTDTAKEILYARMKADPTPADEATSYAIHFPDDPEIFSQTEAQQLVAEELVEKWEKGKMRLLWDNKKRRNEALDCLVYAYAALRVSVQRWQLDLAVLAKSREEETTRPTLKELAAKLSGGVNGYSR